MSAYGSVPAALAGTVDVNKAPGVRSGIFEYTRVDNRKYVTRLEFVNVPFTVVKGSNAGFVGLEIYDFGKALLEFHGANVALTAVVDTAKITEGAAAVFTGLGTSTATDVAKASATTGENNLVAFTANAQAGTGTEQANVRSATLASSLGAPQLLDGTGTAKKVFLNINVAAASLSASTTAAQTLSGIVELHYEDLGADLA